MHNQSLISHLLCYDPVYPKNQGEMHLIAYGGSEELFEGEAGIRYLDDGRVRLSYYGPKAGKVTVRYNAHDYQNSREEDRLDPEFFTRAYRTVEMKKGPDQYWAAVIDPGPGYHDVFYQVDGVDVINTQAPFGYDGYGIYNFIDLPDDEDFLLAPVEHGTLSREIFFSRVTGRYRASWVYVPASYHKTEKRYPVLYIQHGGAEDEVCWFQSGKLDILMDNLIAQGRAEEMIIVANSGYTFREIGENQFAEKRFEDMLAEDCIPFIDQRYRTVSDRRSRAVAGLSMGGGHARRAGFRYNGLFSNVGMFSSGEGFPLKTEDCDFTALFSDPEHFNQWMDCVMVTVGKADPRFDRTMKDVKPLLEKGYRIRVNTYAGHHEWNVWRKSAKDFICQLFQKRRDPNV